MSSILKALRKVENEKASLGQGGVDLAHDILKKGYDEPKRVVWPYILIGALCVIGVAGLALYFFVQSPDDPIKGNTNFQVNSSVQETQSQQSEIQEKPAKELPVSSESVSRIEVPVNNEITNSIVEDHAGEIEKQAVIDLPNLRIDEIVYHDVRDSRLAVVNDLPVMEGTIIEGARVEEILPDRVRFVYEGVSFNKFSVSQ